MASLKTKFTVGLFVLIGIALAVVAVIWVGMSHYFEKGNYYVAYFDESVQGLNRDSPVKFMGVSIGRVDSVSVAPDATVVQVVLKIETGLKLEEDMVAHLKSVGITGIIFVELQRRKEGQPDLSPKISFPSKYTVVATKPSGTKRFLQGIDDLLNQINALDIEEISNKLKSTLSKISQSVDDAQIKGLSSDIRSSLIKVETATASLNTLAANANKTVLLLDKPIATLDRIFAENEKGLTEAIEDFGLSLRNASTFLGQGTDLIRGTDARLASLQQQFMLTLQNLEKASDNLNRFIELISDNPSRLLFGQPPSARNVEQD